MEELQRDNTKPTNSFDLHRHASEFAVLADAEFSTFRDICFVAEGGMSTVYKAYDPILDRAVAIKILKAGSITDPVLISRFETEARLLASLVHPNMVTVYKCGILSSGCPYMIMDFVDGIDLRKFITQKSTRGGRDLQAIFLQVLDVLSSAHKESVVHRDIKPENIMIANPTKRTNPSKTTQSFRYQVYLLDFGIAKILTEQSADVSVTRTGAFIGTPNYMSPEQCMNKPIDARSDVYSLGCVIYEFITGSPPLVSDTATETMYRKVHEDTSALLDVSVMPRLSPALRIFLLNALAKEPDDRYSNAEEMLGDFRKIAIGDLNWSEAGQRSKNLRSWGLGAAVMLLLLMLLPIFSRATQFRSSAPEMEGLSDFRKTLNERHKFIESNEFTKAVQKCEDAYLIAKKNHNANLQVQALKEKVNLEHKYLKDFDAAIATYERLLELSKLYVSINRLHFETRSGIAEVYRDKGEHQKALDYLVSIVNARQSISGASSSHTIIHDRNLLGDCYYGLHRPIDAENVLEKNWIVLKETGDRADYTNAELALEYIHVLIPNNLKLAKSRMKELIRFIPVWISDSTIPQQQNMYTQAINLCKSLGLKAESAALSEKQHTLAETPQDGKSAAHPQRSSLPDIVKRLDARNFAP